MNVHLGLLPPVEGRARKADRKAAYTKRAREKLAEWIACAQLVIPAEAGISGQEVTAL